MNKWTQKRRQVKQCWGKLTDDDLDRIDGDVDDPIGKVPSWAELTGDLALSVRHRMAWLVGATGATVLLAFLFAGQYLLRAFSMELASLQIAGASSCWSRRRRDVPRPPGSAIARVSLPPAVTTIRGPRRPYPLLHGHSKTPPSRTVCIRSVDG